MRLRIIMWTGLAVLLLWGLLRLRPDAEVLNLLPADVPAVEGLRMHQRHFSGSRELWIAVTGEAAGVAAEWAERLGSRLRATPGLAASVQWREPWEEDVSGLMENLAWMWLQQPGPAWNALEARLEPARLREFLGEQRERMATSLDPREIALAGRDPLGLTALPGSPLGSGGTGRSFFNNASGTLHLVMVEPPEGATDFRQSAAWVQRVRDRVELELAAGMAEAGGATVKVGFTGGPVFHTEIASGMERDLRNSVISTVAMICVLFWLAHRTLRPLAFLVAALGLTLVGTLSVGGWVLGTLNVISGGFGAVMMGLVVDYGLVGYQEARADPGAGLAEIRRRIRPGIGWSAVTTAGTFLSLGFAGLPGLGQLGFLTAVGLGLGAVVMVWGFLPLAMGRAVKAVVEVREQKPRRGVLGVWGLKPTLWVTGVIGMLVLGVLVGRGFPEVTAGTDPLRPRESEAYDVMAQVQRELGRKGGETWLIFKETDPDRLAERMTEAGQALAGLESEGRIGGYQLPGLFWPRPVLAAENGERAKRMIERMPAIRGMLEEEGDRKSVV